MHTKLKQKKQIKVNGTNNINDDFAVIPLKAMSKLCGVEIKEEQYRKICSQLKQITLNLIRKDTHFLDNFLTDIENNSLILGIEMASKKTQKLAIRVQTTKYSSGAEKVAKAFAKEGMIFLPKEISSATEAALRLKTGPRVRNFSFMLATRQLVSEHRLALMQKRTEKLCPYNGDKIKLTHYFLCPLMSWFIDLLEKTLLFTYSVVDNTNITYTLGRRVTKSYDNKVKGFGKTIQAMYCIARFLVHKIHTQNSRITDKSTLLDIYKNLISRYTIDPVKEQAQKVVNSAQVCPVKSIDTNYDDDKNTIFYSKEQMELWKAQTSRSVLWDIIQREREQWHTKEKLKRTRAYLYTLLTTEEEKNEILRVMQDDILYLTKMKNSEGGKSVE